MAALHTLNSLGDSLINPDIQIGVANLPNQRYKIVAKRGATFTIMVAGESGLGKTTFVNTLFATTVKSYVDNKQRFHTPIRKTVEIGITKADLEERGFHLRLNVIDTPGFGDNVNNKEAWQPIVEFLDDQHEAFLRQEQQPDRRSIIDMRVHACLYFIRPTGHSLKPLDIEAMRNLSTRVNLIPVIAKADTLSPQEIHDFKRRIREILDAQKIHIYTPTIDDPAVVDPHGYYDPTGPADGSTQPDPMATSEAKAIRELIDAMPFSVIGSENVVERPEDGAIVLGRKYLWGVAEVENDNHCDFLKLRLLLIRSHMLDLVQSTEDVHYENYRSKQMETRKLGDPRPRKWDNPKYKKEEEELRKTFTNQVRVEEQRFRQWEQNLISERDRLNHDLEETHSAIRRLEEEIDTLSSYSRRR
ncbi:uncharacterized protein SAPINGB_P005223 [Magnusiomyces paraingens]|uniref:Septin-type G domain-containing protein n=1 Tax=Magnusiomyces paraingens TaxID=2606893 RepID=A0A5E8BZ33_9ASCO|nr:uncharacterized protein SAPINGB_P005223 [Saprochaete ingens]VVT56704.1 unnamed protein product [Saprochaete ingens]